MAQSYPSTRLINETDVTRTADIPAKSRSGFSHEIFSYQKEIIKDREPWFMKPVFHAFAAAIDQSPGEYRTYIAAAPVVGKALRNDPSFMSDAQVFSDENAWNISSNRLVNLLVLAYKHEANSLYYNSPHGGAELRELINKQEKPPCSPADAELVLKHLRKVLTERSGVFQSPHDANIAVEASLINDGTTHLKRDGIRKTISWHARVDRAAFATLFPHVSPDGSSTGKSEVLIETTFTRGRMPIGPIGSTRAAFSRGRGLTKDRKSGPAG